MDYLVITGVTDNKLYHAKLISGEDYSYRRAFYFSSWEGLVDIVVKSNGQISPLNFSIGRNKELLQNCGDFSRFSKSGSAVVIAEIKSNGGRTLGYRLLSCAKNVCVNMKLDEILLRESRMPKGERFLQNGIIRNKTVNCYPLHPFPVVILDDDGRKKSAERKKLMDKDARKLVEEKKPKPQKSEFTPEQLKEFESCKLAGVNPHFIMNPKLSPKQMRVLWVSKAKGCLSEVFAKPEYSVDVMKFYADRLYDKRTVNDCSWMLKNPNLSVDELAELYMCVCKGIPYSNLIGLSAVNINIERERLSNDLWGGAWAFDKDLEGTLAEKALNTAMRMQERL